MYFSEALLRTATFLEELLQEQFFQKTVTFPEKLVLRNQFQGIYTWKDFQLTSIHSFKYIMVWSDFDIPQSFIVENSKQSINFNTGCVRKGTF